MEERKNLCAMLPVALHARVRQEQEKAGMTLGEYVEAMITEYYDWKDGKIMTGEMRTLAAQIPAELFDRLGNSCIGSQWTKRSSYSQWSYRTFQAE